MNTSNDEFLFYLQNNEYEQCIDTDLLSIYPYKNTATDLPMNTGRWTRDEDNLILLNWEKFCSDYPQVVGNEDIIFNPIKWKCATEVKRFIRMTKLYYRIANGIQRCVFNVYCHAKRCILDGSRKKGSVTPSDVSRLRQLYNEHGPRWSIIGAELDRKPDSMRKLFERVQNTTKTTQKWNIAELEMLFRSIYLYLTDENFTLQNLKTENPNYNPDNEETDDISQNSSNPEINRIHQTIKQQLNGKESLSPSLPSIECEINIQMIKTILGKSQSYIPWKQISQLIVTKSAQYCRETWFSRVLPQLQLKNIQQTEKLGLNDPFTSPLKSSNNFQPSSSPVKQLFEEVPIENSQDISSQGEHAMANSQNVLLLKNILQIVNDRKDLITMKYEIRVRLLAVLRKTRKSYAKESEIDWFRICRKMKFFPEQATVLKKIFKNTKFKVINRGAFNTLLPPDLLPTTEDEAIRRTDSFHYGNVKLQRAEKWVCDHVPWPKIIRIILVQNNKLIKDGENITLSASDENGEQTNNNIYETLDFNSQSQIAIDNKNGSTVIFSTNKAKNVMTSSPFKKQQSKNNGITPSPKHDAVKRLTFSAKDEVFSESVIKEKINSGYAAREKEYFFSPPTSPMAVTTSESEFDATSNKRKAFKFIRTAPTKNSVDNINNHIQNGVNVDNIIESPTLDIDQPIENGYGNGNNDNVGDGSLNDQTFTVEADETSVTPRKKKHKKKHKKNKTAAALQNLSLPSVPLMMEQNGNIESMDYGHNFPLTSATSQGEETDF